MCDNRNFFFNLIIMMNLKTRTLKQKLAMLVIMCLLSMTDTWAQFSSSPDVEVKNNSFYIDGKKFFIKGIGYEIGALPGNYRMKENSIPTSYISISGVFYPVDLILFVPGLRLQNRNWKCFGNMI